LNQPRTVIHEGPVPIGRSAAEAQHGFRRVCLLQILPPIACLRLTCVSIMHSTVGSQEAVVPELVEEPRDEHPVGLDFNARLTPCRARTSASIVAGCDARRARGLVRSQSDTSWADGSPELSAPPMAEPRREKPENRSYP